MGRAEFVAGSDRAPHPNPLPVNGARGFWSALLRRAVAMGLAPEVFWRLSWREWQMLNGADVPVAMERASFEALMQEFPDR